MLFDPKADPEVVADHVAELALHQLERLHEWMVEHPLNGDEFYMQAYEIVISNEISKLMGGYAVLKGHASAEQARLVWHDRRRSQQ